MRNILCFTDLSPEIRKKILRGILKVYKDCSIQTFPIDCSNILEHYNFKLYSYTDLKGKNQELYEMCKLCTNDAFSWNRIVAYNEKILSSRIRFSLMHELGHHILGIPSTSQEFENIVDYFTSYLLAPRILIHKYGYESAEQIRSTFNLSARASNNALADYKIWFQYICQTTRKPSKPEIELENLFFPKIQAKEISQKGKPHLSSKTEERMSFFEELKRERGNDYMFQRAEAQWLYGRDY